MPEKIYELIIPENYNRERLDVFLTHEFPFFSRAQVQKLIKEDHVTLNGRSTKANHQIRPGETLKITIPIPRKSDIPPENIPLDIYYEDEHLLVLNKPAGIVVHPAIANRSGTLVNALLYHCKKLSGIGGVERPGIVHRLDKNTSGLMVIAKDDLTHRSLSEQFSRRTTEREYRAIIWGTLPEESGCIQTYLRRSHKDRTKIAVSPDHKGKLAITNYAVLEKFHLFSLVKLKLQTGRTHQIRVHLKHMGHPVFGDPAYGGRNKQLPALNHDDRQQAIALLKQIPYQALHARTLGFLHPVRKEFMRFDSELPSLISELLVNMRQLTV